MAAYPGLDIFAASPAPEPGGREASVVFRNAGLIVAGCWPQYITVAVYEAAERPASVPGKQSVLNETLPQAGCINSTTAPWWNRCYPLRGRALDVAQEAKDSVASRPVAANYVLRYVDMDYLCRFLVSDECAREYGPLACNYIESRNFSASPFPLASPSPGPPPAANDPSLQQASPQPPGEGDAEPEDDVLVPVLCGVLGGVAFLALMAASAFVMYRRGGCGSCLRARGPEGGYVASLKSSFGDTQGSKMGSGRTRSGSSRVMQAQDGPTKGAPGPDDEGPSPHIAVAVQDTSATTHPAEAPSPGGAAAPDPHATAAAAAPSPLLVSDALTSGAATTTTATDGTASTGVTALLEKKDTTVTTETSDDPNGFSAPHQGYPGYLATSGEAAVVVTAFSPHRPGLELEMQPDAVTLGPRRLGKGGFGVVQEGVFQGRPVAVKLLPRELLAVGPQPQPGAGAQAGTGTGAEAGPVPGEAAGGEGAGGTPKEALGSLTAAQLSSLAAEVEVLGRCDHRNVVRLLAACLTPPQPCLVMELMETSLDRLIHRGPDPGALLPLPLVYRLAQDVAEGLAYLHPTVLHRDLKPANVLVNMSGPQPVAKIADFGLSRLRSTVLVTESPEVGTAAYMAPELFDLTNTTVTHGADMWAFGVLLWELLSGQHPWEGRTLVQIGYAVTLGGERLSVNAIPPDRRNHKTARLIEQCFADHPRKRPAAAEAAKELLLLEELIAEEARVRKLEEPPAPKAGPGPAEEAPGPARAGP
ncbi:hypothetical protein HYH03_002248 [Edaphochlamys debaryana]|uniref:Protein kinase domain-containing protein n=1 Tax=Edaphochlamys debaryana TaxID=47281 RepID=A0A836C5F9_9CHLO|nr:hypothetical protein HYH03_002248 [Edaphochlamys debaryana]|eukprot:KAG2499963.1 hypothetical protein HYH03_002248 [Edaphochlamys debaryana]